MGPRCGVRRRFVGTEGFEVRIAFLLAILLSHEVFFAAEQGATIRYTLSRDAMVTLNVTRPDGWVVRELIVGQRKSAGAHEVRWDGRDNLGFPLPPGDYRWRLVQHDGLAWEYLTSVGNGGTPPWKTPDGTGGWGGNHGQNTAVATDETGVYLGWVSTEGPHCILKRTHDGARGLWGIHLGPFEGVIALATDGQFLFGINARRLLALDRSNGKVLGETKISAEPAGDVKAPLPPELTAFSWSFATHKGPPKGDPLVWGLAAGGGRVYVSLPWRDTIEVFGVEAGADGKVKLAPKHEESISVPLPGGLALDGQGGLLAVSVAKKSILRVDLKSKTAQPLIGGLGMPLGLARAADGTLFLTEGPPLHQILRFASDGKPLGAFGRKGGPHGDNTGYTRYEPDAFCQPCAVAANPDGTLWFVDDLFKRMGLLSREGRLLYEGFGSVNYAAACALNPNDPTEVFTTMWDNVTFKIDFEKPGWSRPNRKLMLKFNGDRMGVGGGWGAQRMLARDGRTYLWTGDHLAIDEGTHLRPAMWFHARIPDKGPLAELAKKRGAKSRGWNTDPTIWCDLNGDGGVQEDEIQFVPLPQAKHGPQFFGHGGLSDDFSLVTYGYTWKPQRFTEQGVPVYRAEEIAFSEAWNPLKQPSYEGKDPIRLENGNYCARYHPPAPGMPTGNGFWSGRSTSEGFIAYGPDWKPLWSVGQKAYRQARQGECYSLYRSIGALDGCAFFGDVEGCVHVVHQDGFYLQRVLQDGWHTQQSGPDVIDVENFSGSVFRHPRSGKRYLTISSSEATHVFELKGFESIQVSPPQPFTLAAPASLSRASGPYRIRRVPEKCEPLPGHMGGLLPQSGLDWMRDVEPFEVRDGTQLAAEVRLLHDGRMLYGFVNVLSSAPEDRAALAFDAKAGAIKGDPLAAPTICLEAAGPGGAPVRAAYAKLALHPGEQMVMGKGNDWTPLKQGKEGLRADVRPTPSRSGCVYLLQVPLETWGVRVKPGEPATFRLNVLCVEPDAQGVRTARWQAAGPASWNEVVLDTEPALRGAEGTAVAARASKPVAIDGDDREWKDAPVYALPEGRAAFRVCWDDRQLYAFVRVQDPTPLQNRSSTPEMIFKGGDAVAIALGPVKEKGGGGAPQKAIFAWVDGKPVAMLYRPKRGGLEEKPYVFKSPVSEVTFEHVSALPGAQAAFQPVEGGYVAELALPWKALGYAPAAGQAIPFDVQAIFSDATGSRNAGCAWWRSVSAEAHANNDIPTEARLYPKEWGTLVLK